MEVKPRSLASAAPATSGSRPRQRGGLPRRKGSRRCGALPPVREAGRALRPVGTGASGSIVYWKRRRVFAGAYIERRRLELNIDLLREAEHPCLIAAFHTTKRVVTHRLRITETDQLDDSIAALLAEAYEDVGPGTRSR
jgi:uncharacterized protein DUF5655